MPLNNRILDVIDLTVLP